MTFKAQWYRDKFAKKRGKGFCGYPVATVAFYGPDDTRATKVSVGIVAHEGADADRQWTTTSAPKTGGNVGGLDATLVATGTAPLIIGASLWISGAAGRW